MDTGRNEGEANKTYRIIGDCSGRDIYVKVVCGRKKWLIIPLPLISLKWMFKQTLLLLALLQLQLSGLCKKTNAESFITVNCWSFPLHSSPRCIICSTKTFQGLIIFPLWKVKQKLLYVTQVFNLMLCWCIYLCILYCVSHVSKHHKNVIVWGLECLQGVPKSL